MKTEHHGRAPSPRRNERSPPPAYDRLALTKVLVGGGVLALLVITYLLLAYSGRDQRHLLDIIGLGIAYMLGARGGRAG